MCGAESMLVHAKIEGTELTVCKKCAGYGQVLGRVRIRTDSPDIPKSSVERIQAVKPDFAEVIRRKRESLGLTQKDFAKKLNEKESLIHKIETGGFEPSLTMARKFERVLGITLVEQIEEKHETSAKKSSDQLTIGDLIKIRKG